MLQKKKIINKKQQDSLQSQSKMLRGRASRDPSPLKGSGESHSSSNTPFSSSSGSNSSNNNNNNNNSVIDEKEREKEKKLAEQRAINALNLQRKQRLEALIRKRKANLQYLKVKILNHNPSFPPDFFPLPFPFPFPHFFSLKFL